MAVILIAVRSKYSVQRSRTSQLFLIPDFNVSGSQRVNGQKIQQKD